MHSPPLRFTGSFAVSLILKLSLYYCYYYCYFLIIEDGELNGAVCGHQTWWTIVL